MTICSHFRNDNVCEICERDLRIKELETDLAAANARIAELETELAASARRVGQLVKSEIEHQIAGRELAGRIRELQRKLEPMPEDAARKMFEIWYDENVPGITLIRRVEAWHEQR